MTKKDLVQELRELAKDEESPTCSVWAHFAGLGMISCNRRNGCGECRGLALNALSDRIEAEYEPKPEPDTVEKVARDMYATFHEVAYIVAEFKGKNFTGIAEGYRKRLEALGVTFDD